MNFEKSKVGDVAILYLKGEFDTFEVSRFAEELENLESLGFKKVILNVRFLRFINSTALGAIVKAKRTITAKGGELVIAQPGKFVANVLDTLGLGEIIPIFGEAEEALDHFKADTKKSVGIEGDNVLLFNFKNAEHAASIRQPFCIGKIEEIDDDSLRFIFDLDKGSDVTDIEPKLLFAPGSELHLKFRLPFYKKAYYFECTGRILETRLSKSSAKVIVKFMDLADDDLKSIRQFVADMRFLKNEIRAKGD